MCLEGEYCLASTGGCKPHSLLGEKCLSDAECESQLCNKGPKAKKGVCILPPNRLPTKSPTESPTTRPTESPTKKPTVSPSLSQMTESPTKSPTESPSGSPTASPAAESNYSPPCSSVAE